jgi:hypothetical protein
MAALSKSLPTDDAPVAAARQSAITVTSSAIAQRLGRKFRRSLLRTLGSAPARAGAS